MLLYSVRAQTVQYGEHCHYTCFVYVSFLNNVQSSVVHINIRVHFEELFTRFISCFIFEAVHLLYKTILGISEFHSLKRKFLTPSPCNSYIRNGFKKVMI